MAMMVVRLTNPAATDLNVSKARRDTMGSSYRSPQQEIVAMDETTNAKGKVIASSMVVAQMHATKTPLQINSSRRAMRKTLQKRKKCPTTKAIMMPMCAVFERRIDNATPTATTIASISERRNPGRNFSLVTRRFYFAAWLRCHPKYRGRE